MPRPRVDRDYYRILGLAPGATEEEIRKAYRRLALEWHPDRRPGDPGAGARFGEISEAYAVLINPARRREYDAARRAGAPGDFRASREDLFRDLFADPRASAVFEDLARELQRLGLRADARSFRETLFGGRVVVAGAVVVLTPWTLAALFRLARAALGGGRPPVEAPGAPAQPRPGGLLGRLARAGRWLLGLPPAPRGEDLVAPLPLTRAEAERGGPKRVTLSREGRLEEVLVRIPRGIRPGTRLRLRDKGRPGPDGAAGDMYLVVEIVEGGR